MLGIVPRSAYGNLQPSNGWSSCPVCKVGWKLEVENSRNLKLFLRYGWWKKYPIIYKVLAPSRCLGFLPSTVSCECRWNRPSQSWGGCVSTDGDARVCTGRVPWYPGWHGSGSFIEASMFLLGCQVQILNKGMVIYHRDQQADKISDFGSSGVFWNFWHTNWRWMARTRNSRGWRLCLWRNSIEI